jgi:hypothetical protein
MSAPLAYYYKTDHKLTVPVADIAGVAATGATVTGTLVTKAGVAVTKIGGGAMDALTFTDVGDGTYTADVQDDLDVRDTNQLWLRLTATKSGKQAYAEIAVLVTVDRT